jgi:hypothetical protein
VKNSDGVTGSESVRALLMNPAGTVAAGRPLPADASSPDPALRKDTAISTATTPRPAVAARTTERSRSRRVR